MQSSVLSGLMLFRNVLQGSAGIKTGIYKDQWN